jgi:hypothetical protein
MCGTIDPGHTYDEYLVLLAKLGIERLTSIELLDQVVDCRRVKSSLAYLC